MGKKGIIALMSCVFALCLALVGCGGGNSEAAAKSAFTGTWDLVEMSQGDEVTGADELETLKSLGLEVFVNLNEDGTSALVLFGEVLDGTWEATSASEGSITMDGQTVTMTLADSKLTFEQEGAKLTFEKGEAKEAPAAEESTSSTVEESSADEAVATEEQADEATASEVTEIAENTADEAAPAEDAAATETSESSSASSEEASSSSSASAQ